MATLEKQNSTSPAVVKLAARPKLITGEADITKGIKSVQGRGQSLQKDLHIIACSVMAHIEKHRADGVNANLANALVSALPEGMRKNALLDWFCAHAAVTFNEETKKLMFDKAQNTHQIKGELTPFWLFKVEGEYKAFDFNAELTKLLAKAERHMTTNKHAADKLDINQITKAKELVIVEEVPLKLAA